ncbi:MAG TPA: N-acetylmuramoyl-L-alanine amidase [Alphaproteobacteria bacterium]|nr:N-acetylmuramoyl-L-alanine amidase [Alphaproteobacteria bacterium]
MAVAVYGQAALAAAPPSVSAVSIGDQGGTTRLVLELSQRADYRAFLLNEPMRLVLELPTVRWKLAAQAPSAGVIAGYRFGQFDADTARLVVDLAAPARVKKSGYELQVGRSTQRLVLELEPVAAEVFATAVQPWMSSGSGLKTAPVAPPAPPAPTPQPALAPQPMRPPAPPVAEPRPPSAVAAVPAAVPSGAARTAPRREGRKIIVLDPGHGGVDPGALGANGTHEKDLTLAVARELRRQLEATGRYRVVMTRDDDVFVQLRERVNKARAADADLFLSIHADSIGSAQTRGASIYTLSETASDAEAAALAARENRADIIAGVDLSTENKDVASILIDLAQRETMNRSAALAHSLVAELGRDIQLLPSRPHRFAGFAVLKAPDVPSALIELGYLSNRQDESLLNRPQHRSKIAAAIVRAIDNHFGR